MNLDVFHKNQLLRHFPKVGLERLAKKFRSIPLPIGQLLYEQRGRIDNSYFPLTCCLSSIVTMTDGNMIEVATVGKEGGVGIYLSTSARTSSHRVLAQIPGECLSIDTDAIEGEAEQNAELKCLLDHYQTAFLFQVSQSVACNGLHKVEARCCRWLLMSHDRVEGDEFYLTHEFLSHMLGVRRSTVSEILQELQDRGLITYSRGKITVRDRLALEESSCECYEIVRQEYRRLLP